MRISQSEASPSLKSRLDVSHQQQLETALAHHQAERYQEAETIYRRVLSEDPNNGDALHWLGLLAHQHGKSDLALGLIGRALQFRSDIASYHHNFAEAWLAVGEVEQAIACYRQALHLNANSGATHGSLAMALVRCERHDLACEHFTRAIELGVVHAQIHHHFGIASIRTGNFDEAIAQLKRAIELDANLHEAHHHLGEALGLQGETDAAAEAFRKAIALKSDFARPYHGLGVVCGRRGRLDEARVAFQTAIERRPDYPEAEQGLASLCHRAGEIEDAVHHYSRAIELRSGYLEPRLGLCKLFEQSGNLTEAIKQCRELVRLRPGTPSLEHYLAALTGTNPPATSPPAMIAAQFDNYAEHFDEHLVDVLSYRAPELLLEAVKPFLPPEQVDIIDLGCGTGLCGQAFRPHARRIAGIDLSTEMLTRAERRGVYDDLHHGDLTEHLLKHDRQFDLAISTDVFIYVGDLATVFEAATHALRPGGLLAFSVESHDGDGFKLQLTRRYAHSASYLRQQAERFGFREQLLREAAVRTECYEDVPGFVVVLQLAP